MNTPISKQLDDRFAELRASYLAAGLGSPVGFGSKPAVVVVDFSYGFTDPASRLGAVLDAEVTATATMLEAARAAAVPIIFLSVGYLADGSDGGPFMAKCPSLADLVLGSKWCDIDSRLDRRSDEPLVMKRVASGFVKTELPKILSDLAVDTVLLAGTTTSGCVRATAVDACSYGFRTIVVADCVGDRSEDRHWTSLFDLDSKYADVVDLTRTLDYLKNLLP